MQRTASLTRHLGAAQSAVDHDLHPEGAGLHGGLHRLLHRAAERHPALQLLGDALGHKAGGQLGALDLVDRQVDRRLRELLQSLHKLVLVIKVRLLVTFQ